MRKFLNYDLSSQCYEIVIIISRNYDMVSNNYEIRSHYDDVLHDFFFLNGRNGFSYNLIKPAEEMSHLLTTVCKVTGTQPDTPLRQHISGHLTTGRSDSTTQRSLFCVSAYHAYPQSSLHRYVNAHARIPAPPPPGWNVGVSSCLWDSAHSVYTPIFGHIRRMLDRLAEELAPARVYIYLFDYSGRCLR